MNTPRTRVVCLPPQRLAVGMHLARPALRADGGVLLPAGTELDESELARLAQRGVECVFVECVDPRDDATIAAEREAMTRRVDHLFRTEGVTDSEARQQLRAAIAGWRLDSVG